MRGLLRHYLLRNTDEAQESTGIIERSLRDLITKRFPSGPSKPLEDAGGGVSEARWKN